MLPDLWDLEYFNMAQTLTLYRAITVPVPLLTALPNVVLIRLVKQLGYQRKSWG